jgi:broad specificity phosphatase PhoE
LFGVYVTHPQVLIDPEVPVPDWGLSPFGRARAEAAARRPWVRRLRRVVTSDERKARETAEVLARAAGVGAEVRPGLHENDRSATGFLPPEEFEAVADAFFADPDRSVRGWETARAAQARVLGAVAAVLDAHPPDQPIAFVGHGGVGTLLRLALGRAPISRAGDQPPGGGNLFVFDLAARRPLTGWTPFEEWDGPEAVGLAERNENN